MARSVRALHDKFVSSIFTVDGLMRLKMSHLNNQRLSLKKNALQITKFDLFFNFLSNSYFEFSRSRFREREYINYSCTITSSLVFSSFPCSVSVVNIIQLFKV